MVRPDPRAFALGFIPSPPLGAGDMVRPDPRAFAPGFIPSPPLGAGDTITIKIRITI